MTEHSDQTPDPNWDGPEGDAARAGEYALGLLPEAERAAFEDRLRIEPALRRMVVAWETDLSGMLAALPPESVPERVWRSLEQRLFASAADTQTTGLWRRLGWLRPALGGLAVAVVLWGAITLGGAFLSGPETRVIATLSGDSGLYTAEVSVEPATHTLIFARTTPPPADGRVHELWLIVGEAAPQSLGVLPPSDEMARVTLDDPTATLLDGAVLAISDEPLGGSPTGAPTGDVLAVAQIDL